MAEHPVFQQHGVRPWYDDPRNIEASLADYSTFFSLLSARRESFRLAQKLTGESFPKILAEWYVLDGTIWLDSQGFANPRAESEPLPEKFLKRLGNRKVAARDEFANELAFWEEDRKADPENLPFIFASFALGLRIPLPTICCPHCSRGWKVEDIGAFSVQSEWVEFRPKKSEIGKPLPELWKRFENRSDGLFVPLDDRSAVRSKRLIDRTPDPQYPTLEINPSGYYPLKSGEAEKHLVRSGDLAQFQKLKFVHQSCRMAEKNRECKKSIRKAFQDAGFGTVSMEAVPSRYHQGYPDWYVVTTEIGTIEIGPRKRVVHIGVEGVKKVLKLHILFKDEDVTKTERSVHAWTMEKTAEYLRKIRESALPQRPKTKTRETAGT